MNVRGLQDIQTDLKTATKQTHFIGLNSRTELINILIKTHLKYADGNACHTSVPPAICNGYLETNGCYPWWSTKK